ncbi:MAG: Ig-like domain-containing protein [Clostridia bacterium]|nr:Ig-like domain-containing protein [Clostridia bacterium]
MRKTLNRVLACFLSVALLVSCCISGLILPAAADTPNTNLILDVNFDGEGSYSGWEIANKTAIVANQGFGGSKALEWTAGGTYCNTIYTPTLEANKLYVLRYKVSGGDAGIKLSSLTSSIISEGSNGVISNTSNSTAWKEFFVLFKINAEKLSAVQLNRNDTSKVVYFDDIQIEEYKLGMNLAPNANGAALPIANVTHLLKNFTEATDGKNAATLATDGDNSVWKFTAASAEPGKRLYFHGLAPVMTAGAEFDISFRYKAIKFNTGAENTHLAAPQLTIISDASGKVTISNSTNSAADENGWKTFNATFKVNEYTSQMFLLRFTHSASEVLVDDFVLAQKTSVDITEETKVIGVGDQVTLNATIVPADADVEWTSSDESIATVDSATGKVTGVKQGTVTITATIEDGKSDTCEVSVTIPATALTLNKTQLHLVPGGYQTLLVTPTPADASLGNITWNSDNTAVATVDNNGKVTAIGDGTATITVSNGTFSQQCAVTVDAYGNRFIGGDMESDSDASVWEKLTTEKGAIIPEPGNEANHVLSVNSGKQFYYVFGDLLEENTVYTFTGRVKGSVHTDIGTGAYLEWNLSGGTIISNNPDRWAICPTTGTDGNTWVDFEFTFQSPATINKNYALVICNKGDSFGYFDDLKLVKRTPPALESLTIVSENDTDMITVGSQALNLSVTQLPIGMDVAAGTLTWTSSNTAVATVEKTGEKTAAVTPGVAGEAVITVQSESGVSDTFTVKVVQLATAIDITESTYTFGPEAAHKLTVNMTPAGSYAGVLEWTSSNENAVKVENGVITGVKPGMAVITATSPVDSSITDSMTVVVTEYGEMLTGGDFESDTDLGHWNSILNPEGSAGGSIIVDPADPNNHILSFKPCPNTSVFWQYFGFYKQMKLEPETTYVVSGKVKGEAKPAIGHGNIAYAYKNTEPAIVNGNKQSGEPASEYYYVGLSKDSWNDFTFTFRTNSNAASGTGQIFGLGNFGVGICYFDDLKLSKQEPQTVTEITLSKTEATYGVGVTTQLNFTTTPLNADLSTLAWTSSNPSVATVDQNGKVVTVAPGTTVITVKTSDTVKATCTLTVERKATAISLSSNTLSLIPNSSDVLTVIATPYGAEVTGLVWHSSDTTVATVDNNGKVTAVGDGTATITVSNGTLSAQCAVKVSNYGELLVGGDFQDTPLPNNWAAMVNGTAAEVVDDPYVDGNKYMTLKVGQTTGVYTGLTLKGDTLYKLSLRAKGFASTITISREAAAKFYPADTATHKTVSDGDKWTTTTIYFRTEATGNLSDILSFKANNNGVTHIDDISLTEVPVLTGISISEENNTTFKIAPGNKITLTARPIPSDSFIEDTVVWSSADGTVASVSQSGEVTAGVQGTTTISAKVFGYAPATVTVESDYYANLVHDGDFAKKNIKWAFLNATKQESNKSGVYEGIGENGTNGFRLLTQGTNYYYGPSMVLMPNNSYKITVRYKSSVKAKRMHEVYFDAGAGTLELNGTNGQWTTLEKVFTVPPTYKSKNYQLSFNALMETTMQDDVVIDSIDIRMYDSGVDTTSANINPPTLQMTPGQKLSYILTVTPNKANTNFLTWTSSNENVVIVNNGAITAVGAGTSTITVSIPTSTGVPVTAQSVVTVVGDEAFIKNGTFDIEGDTSWTLENATVVPNAGMANSGALAMTNASVVTQTLTGLKPGTVYVATVSTNSPNLVINAKIKKDGVSTPYMAGRTPTASGWQQTAFEFVVPDDYDGSALTFELTAADSGTGYVDNIYLTEGFSEADLIVSDLVWNEGETQMKPGTPVNFTVVLVNAGTEATKSNRDIVVEIRVNNKVIRTLVHKGGLGATDADRLVALTTDPNDPWLATEGELVISAHVNTTLSVLESNTKNNGMQTYIRVAEEALVAPQTALDGGFNKLVFSDDFDTANVDENFTGDYGYKWYLNNVSKKPAGDKNDYQLTDDGILLNAKNMTNNWLLTTIDSKSGAGWEGFTHGYLEFRARFEDDHNELGSTVGPAVWSFDTEKILYGSDHWVELDWMEYWHTDGHDPVWTVSFHENIIRDAAAPWGGEEQVYYNEGHNYVRDPKFNIATGDWVTVGFRWQKGLIIGYVNGEECYRQRWGGKDGPVPDVRVKTGEYNPDAYEYLDEQKLQLILGGDYRWPMELDYIRVWQEDGTLESKPVLDNTFLEDHMTDADGNLYTSVTAENYEAIIAGWEDWVELDEDQQAVINEILIAAGGQEYPVLWFEAETLAGTVDAFVSYYACDEYGDPYTVVDDSNYEWILESKEEWESLTDIERAAINAKVKALCGMTFDEMLLLAEEFGIPSPDDGVPFPVVALVGLLLGGATLFTTKKRRDEE